MVKYYHKADKTGVKYMFCKNCGKHIDENTQYCEYCGAMQKSADAVPIVSIEGGHSDKKLFKKSTAVIIGAVALAVIILLTGAITVVRFMSSVKAPHGIGDRLDNYFDDDDDMPWEYFDDDEDMDDYYGMYGGNRGGYGGGSGNYGGIPYGGQYPNAGSAPAASSTPAPWWPADENGKYPQDSDYKWPTGDDKYEYYTDSSIPKFESVTGKQPTKVQNEKGNTYYTYDMDEDAYNDYIKVLEERGFKQYEFEAKGKNSYVQYRLGDSGFYEYLIIYKMNDKNKLIIMA